MTMDAAENDPDTLLRRAGQGDAQAQAEVYAASQQRLRQMVLVRMDQRLRARIDPSDVVQEAFMEAFQQLPEYLVEQPLPFYPWLRQIAWNRLVDLHRRHLMARKRSVNREEHLPELADASVAALAERLASPGTSPSGQMTRQEVRARVRAALLQLKESDRELLLLRYVEQLSTSEISAVLGIREGAVKVRHFRALERLRGLLDDLQPEGGS